MLKHCSVWWVVQELLWISANHHTSWRTRLLNQASGDALAALYISPSSSAEAPQTAVASWRTPDTDVLLPSCASCLCKAYLKQACSVRIPYWLIITKNSCCINYRFYLSKPGTSLPSVTFIMAKGKIPFLFKSTEFCCALFGTEIS